MFELLYFVPLTIIIIGFLVFRFSNWVVEAEQRRAHLKHDESIKRIELEHQRQLEWDRFERENPEEAKKIFEQKRKREIEEKMMILYESHLRDRELHFARKILDDLSAKK